MNRVYKTRRGFTLVEMVLVIAIIVLLAAVVGLSVSGLISKSNEGSASIHEQGETLKANNAEKDSKFVAAGY
ncbi:MAG: type II secretion system protein [Clostridiales bacterium]|nr:type II secretion system protein [Clostridiales bacterium]